MTGNFTTGLPPVYAAPGPMLPVDRRPASRVPLAFIAIEIIFQLALLVPALNSSGASRVLLRVGSFGVSLALLFLLRGTSRPFKANIAAFWVVAILILSIFNPTSNSLASASAQCVLYIATLAPLFWMSRVHIDQRMFRRVILLVWLYYSASALLGVVQIYYPGQFQPQLSPIVKAEGTDVEGLKITLANGREVFRPMGLTDTPGGASNAGMWTILFGLGLLLTERKRLLKLACLGSMLVGMMCIYLSQARVNLIVLGVWFLALIVLLAWGRQWAKLSKLGLMIGAVVVAAFVLSVSVGGKDISSRYSGMTGSQGTNLYASERGGFLTYTFTTILPKYPLGAGLGRWGMMNYYFGDPQADASRASVYVEIQWTGWLLDGGIPLTVAYLMMIGLAMLALFRLATRRGPFWLWAALIFAYDLGALAMTFDYTPFTGEMGLEFWFVNALLLTAAACAAGSGREGTTPERGRLAPW